jgi:hypothetical protein
MIATIGAQIGIASNGASGQLGITFTQNRDAGVQAFDAYAYAGVVWKAQDNSALEGTSRHVTGGYFRTGAQVDERGNVTGTYGPSISPLTASFGTSDTKVLFNIPYLGYVFNLNRAACKLITGR